MTDIVLHVIEVLPIILTMARFYSSILVTLKLKQLKGIELININVYTCAFLPVS